MGSVDNLKEADMRIQNGITNYLRDTLEEIARSMLNYQRVLMPAGELYRALIPDEATYHALMNAACYMPRETCYEHRDFVIDTMPDAEPTPNRARLCKLTISIPHGQWLLPESLSVLTPKSELGKRILPTVDTAQDLINLTYIFKQVIAYMPYSNVIPIVFPWVKELVRDTNYRDEEALDLIMRRDFRLTTTDTARERVVKELFALELMKGPHDVPALTREIGEICRRGGQLVTQYRMIKDARPPTTPPGHGTLIPYFDDDAVSGFVKAQWQLVRDHYSSKKLVTP